MYSMPYVELPKTVAAWSPYSWGWKCERCPAVTVHDGHIDPNRNTIKERMKEDKRASLFSMIGSILSHKKKAEV
jgi:hypothetical protein